MRHDFYAYLDRMKYIKRWQLMRSVREENIMEHSQSVAVLAHALAVIRNKYLMAISTFPKQYYTPCTMKPAR